MTFYQEIFMNAFADYQSQKQRAGFQKGFFSSFRHSRILYPALVRLKELLFEARSCESEQEILINHLINNENKNNTHSFNSYLLDQLIKRDNNLDWSFFVKNKVKTFTGILYRGMSRGPELIFKQGLSCNHSSDLISDYIKRKNDRIGISTSKSYNTALDYALKRLSHFFSPPEKVYLYKINYRGDAGLDIRFSNHKNSFLDYIYKVEWKDEVNIATNILPGDILGAEEIRRSGDSYIKTWIANPYYQVSREVETSTQLALRQKIFVHV